MSKGASIFVCFILLFFIHENAFAQLYGTNIFEFQYGNIPYQNNRDLTTSYDQLNLYYDHNSLSFYGRIEQFISPFRQRNYFSLTQRRIQYEDDRFSLRIGNFYETIGRGLLLHGYEIPGSVFEDTFYRTRYAFNRDISGISLDYTSDFWELKALRGRPLLNTFSPNEPDSLRRPELIEAIESTLFFSPDISVGGAYMRLHRDNISEFSEYISLMLNVNLPFDIQLSGEYALHSSTRLGSLGKEDSYAFYAGLNYSRGPIGASLEYKNYNRFTLGSGFNTPPSLIKEHTYPVLNRSTHVLSTQNETGVQAEVFYTFDGGHTLTLNYTTATNEVFNRFDYEEYFIETSYNASEQLSFSLFADYANDDIKGEMNRISGGVIIEKLFDYTWSLTADFQYQQFDRSFNPDISRNYYASLSVNIIPDFTVAAVLEASTDPNLTDHPDTFEVETETRIWFGLNSRYRINRAHTLDVFAGKRRGGPACTSGICYEILDFEGAEIRFSTRF